MNEIHEIMRQFSQGAGEWKQFLKSIKITNLHGWSGQEIHFNFPIVALVGENGIGKSTFLRAAICAYKNKAGKDFYPSNMFMSTRWDSEAMSRATIEYTVRLGDEQKNLRWRKSTDWGFSPKAKKPSRSVYFLDISRTIPLDATAGYAKIAKLASEEAGREVELTDRTLKRLSYVLGRSYDRARFVGTDINADREVGLLTSSYGEISQFHQGAGEDAMLDTFKLLQTIPQQSLLVIDEVENSLHPQAQRRFVQYLLELSREKKLQIILSTHSPFVLEELPEIARVMLVQLSDRKDILYGVSSMFALSAIDDKIHPDLNVFLEDNEAVAMFWHIIKTNTQKYYEYSKRIKALPVGSCNVVNTLGELADNNKLPYKCLAIVDGDKSEKYPNRLALPGSMPPEKQVLGDLKEKRWASLDKRFNVGAGSLFKILDDALVQTDHHSWTEYIGDRIHTSKDVVWEILLDEWMRECFTPQDAEALFSAIQEKLNM